MTNLMNDEYYYAHENYYVGVDPASKADYTGIVVIREVKRWKKHTLGENALTRPEDITVETPTGPEILYLCNYCERVPIGTEYGDMMAHVLDIMGQLESSADGKLTLCLDSTGLGEPLYQQFKKYVLPSGKPIDVTGIVITSGVKWKSVGKHYYTVPKPDLIGAPLAFLGTHQLQLDPKMEYFGALKHELENFTAFKRSEDGKETYGAPLRTGEFDDLVLALSCAAWTAHHNREKAGRAIIGAEVPKGGSGAVDQTRISAMRDAKKGGRWKDLTGFRSD